MILALIVVTTLFFAYLSFKIEMYTAFADLLPKDHPYIRVHDALLENLRRRQRRLLSVEATDGDIFNVPVLEKIKKLTEMIERTPGANNYQIFSIARQKGKGRSRHGLGHRSTAGHVAGCAPERGGD